MNIVFVAPTSLKPRALAVETARAVEAGHRVLLVAEDGDKWAPTPLDERVEVRWIGAVGLDATESALLHFFGRRLPLGLLRRIGRGPLRRGARRAARKWRRKVVDRLDRRLRRRRGKLRERLRIDRVREAVAEWEADWLVLHEASAIEVSVHFLPGLLERRPEFKTTYAFEAPAEPEGAHAA